MYPRILSLIMLTLAVSLAACDGGDGRGGVTPPSRPSANVSGTVVDEAANTPLSGIQVSLAAWTADALPTPVATTNPSGQFAFTVAPGSYLLVIGSNSPTDTTATLHVGVVLNAGNNALTLPTPAPYPIHGGSIPDATFTAAQTSGNFRLMALSSTQQDCLTGANAGRTADSLPLLVPDEFLEEDADVDLQTEVYQNTDRPTPPPSTQPFTEPAGSSGAILSVTGQDMSDEDDGGVLLGNGFELTMAWTVDPCDSWTNTYSYTVGNPPYPYATDPSSVWYGADEENGSYYLSAEMWGTNPEGVGTADSRHHNTIVTPAAPLSHAER